MRTPCSGRSLLVALGLGVLSGCGCNLVGCGFSGLNVRLTSLPTEPYRVELLVSGAQEPSYAYECDGGSECLQHIRFPELLPERVRVRVTTAGGALVTEFPNVDYTKHFPNGRSCEPTCVEATVTARVPV